jgi:hypothetical protein
MKTNLLLKILTLIALIITFRQTTWAQREITLDPSKLIPSDTGYYIKGIDLDKNKDGIMEHYDSCSQEFGDKEHFEKGIQQGFSYQKCMIMPTCPSKNMPTNVSIGYIQLGRSSNVGTPTEVLSAVTSPPIKNFKSLYLEVSPDNSPLATRHIYFFIKYSSDNGLTWAPDSLLDETLDKAGDIHTYDSTSVASLPKDTSEINRLKFKARIKEIITASKAGPIILRVYTDPQPTAAAQRLRIHKLIITADTVGQQPNAIPIVKVDKPSFNVINNVVYAKEGRVSVYNILGQCVGSGASVTISISGIYIIKTYKGKTYKVYVK